MIQFDSVYLSHNDKIIFQNFNLRVAKNEKVLFSGKSGLGKTSLLKLLLGFKSPDKGNISVNGLIVSKKNIREIRQHIFYLSQDIDLINETINQLLTQIFLVNNIKAEKQQINHFLQFLDLPETILQQQTVSLSGGERQRIGLLICFLLNRPIWLLDEPTSALDDLMKQKLADFILNQDKTMIIISHDSAWKNHCKINTGGWI